MAGNKVLMPSASDILASNRQASTNHGLVPSASEKYGEQLFHEWGGASRSGLWAEQ